MPLRITITVVPRGNEEASQVVGSMFIENIGGSGDLGNYSYYVHGKAPMDGTVDDRIRHRGAPIASGTVDGFPRRRHSAWHLVASILARHFGPKGS